MTTLLKVATAVLTCALAVRSVPATNTNDDALYARTASQLLSRDFSGDEISYLLFDLHTRSFIASRWQGADRAIPVGSLVKSFTALAYAEAHQFRFPEHTCRGGASCWFPRGHGHLGIVRATALSCNAYFTQLASHVAAAQATNVAQRFGLNGPGVSGGPETLIGTNGMWHESPEALVRAYAELLGRRSQPGVREFVDGMALAAKQGTAAALSQAVPRLPLLAKTGTGPCTHKRHAPGDGFVLVAWPADAPHYLLLVRRHGTPGSQAAALAGRMLRLLEPQS